MVKLELLKDVECDCDICRQMCRRPCWGTPEDIKKIIDAGFADRLMLDFWACQDILYDIQLLCPALKGHHGKRAPWFVYSKDGCTFWKKGLCELHDIKLKPIEGRVVHCKLEEYHPNHNAEIHRAVAMSWDSLEGKKLVKEWCSTRNLDDEEDDFLGYIPKGGA